MNNEIININLFGGPGVGKSTIAAGLFHEMKKAGYRVEYISEYAKDLVYSKDFFKIKNQLMILARQHHPIFKMEGQVDFLIHDGPFLLGNVYFQQNPHIPEKEFKDLLLAMWKNYRHVNIFLEKTGKYEYQEFGRNQTELEAEQISDQIEEMINNCTEPIHKMKSNDQTIKNIMEILSSL